MAANDFPLYLNPFVPGTPDHAAYDEAWQAEADLDMEHLIDE